MTGRPSVQVTETNLILEILESPAIIVEVSGEQTDVSAEVPGIPIAVSIVNQDPTLVEIEEATTNVQVSSETVVIVEPASVGLQGPAGAAGDSLVSDLLAGEALGGQRVVIVGADNQLYYADNTIPEHFNRILGVTTGAAAPGALATVRVGGEMTEPTWAWDLTKFLYLSTGGLLTQTPPSAGFLIEMGWPISSTTIMVDIKFPILLG